MPTLNEIIERFRVESVEDSQWLYVAKEEPLTPGTSADLGCPDFNEVSGQEVHPAGFMESGLCCTIDASSVAASIRWADRLTGGRDNEAVAKILRYYIRFDAWPESIDAADPPCPEESRLRAYRGFADSLGDEDSQTECRHAHCERGTVTKSVYCRRHHFEQVQGVAYPFND